MKFYKNTQTKKMFVILISTLKNIFVQEKHIGRSRIKKNIKF